MLLYRTHCNLKWIFLLMNSFFCRQISHPLVIALYATSSTFSCFCFFVALLLYNRSTAPHQVNCQVSGFTVTLLVNEHSFFLWETRLQKYKQVKNKNDHRNDKYKLWQDGSWKATMHRGVGGFLPTQMFQRGESEKVKHKCNIICT